jgi:hypothetical protein
MTHERVSQPLGRIAELLVESHARIGLNEIRDLLEALDARAHSEGFEDGQRSADDHEDEAAKRALIGVRRPGGVRSVALR